MNCIDIQLDMKSWYSSSKPWNIWSKLLNEVSNNNKKKKKIIIIYKEKENYMH